MSNYSEEALTAKLAKLSESQDSISLLSHWIIYHRKHCVTSVQTWLQQLIKAQPTRKLAFLYLCNDVVQNSRKKGSDFVTEFAKVLPQAIEHTCGNSSSKLSTKVNRILTIWEERQVYSTSFISSLRKKTGSSVDAPSETGTLNESTPSYFSGWDRFKTQDGIDLNLKGSINDALNSGNEIKAVALMKELSPRLATRISERQHWISHFNGILEAEKKSLQEDILLLQAFESRIGSLSANVTPFSHTPPSLHHNQPTPFQSSIHATNPYGTDEEYTLDFNPKVSKTSNSSKVVANSVEISDIMTVDCISCTRG